MCGGLVGSKISQSVPPRRIRVTTTKKMGTIRRHVLRAANNETSIFHDQVTLPARRFNDGQTTFSNVLNFRRPDDSAVSPVSNKLTSHTITEGFHTVLTMLQSRDCNLRYRMNWYLNFETN